jgi:hypothetical protein
LETLSLLEKKNDQIRALSGGMKRRVLIAKALALTAAVASLQVRTRGASITNRWGLAFLSLTPIRLGRTKPAGNGNVQFAAAAAAI